MVVKCDQLIFKPVSPLAFQISGGTKVLTSHKIEDVIHSIEGPEGLNLTLGLTVEVKKIKYKINIIEEKWVKNVLTYELSVAKRTKSSLFIMPILNGTRNMYFWDQLFMNCFIKIKGNDKCIALLYRFSADPLFLKFEKALSRFKNFIKREDPTNDCVLFIFEIPSTQEDNYNKIINGKYSKIDKKYKIDLLDFHNIGVHNLIGQVLFQDPRRKEELEEKLGVELPEDSELLSIMNIDDETFNPEIYF